MSKKYYYVYIRTHKYRLVGKNGETEHKVKVNTISLSTASDLYKLLIDESNGAFVRNIEMEVERRDTTEPYDRMCITLSKRDEFGAQPYKDIFIDFVENILPGGGLKFYYPFPDAFVGGLLNLDFVSGYAKQRTKTNKPIICIGNATELRWGS